MNKVLVILSSIIFLFSVSCSSELEETEVSFQNVDEELLPFFDSFEMEGKKRGLQIDLESAGITGVIQNISDDGVAGTCQYGSHIAHVTIDRGFWNHSNDDFKEYVVFHELGHCYLGRGHYDQALNNGNCASVMHSGLTDCRIVYGEGSKADLLDELFLGD